MHLPSYLLGKKAGGGGAGITYQVVEELPTVGEEGVIYLVPKSTSLEDNIYNEYMYLSGEWELIGDTQADISGKQDTMQYSTMPTPNESTIGKVVQYIGTTNNNYTNGYFYLGVTDGEDPATYSWENLNVQASSLIDYNIYFLDLGTTSTGVDTDTANFLKSLWNKTEDELKKIIIFDINNSNSDGRVFRFLRKTDNIVFNSENWTEFNAFPFGGYHQMARSIYSISFNGSIVNKKTITSHTLARPRFLSTDTNYSTPYTPQYPGSPATKKYVDDKVTTYTGYDATKTQVLKNVNGTLTWVDE